MRLLCSLGNRYICMYIYLSLYARLILKCTRRYCTVMHTNGSTASTTNYCINLTTVIDFENADGIAAHSTLPRSLPFLSLSLSLYLCTSCANVNWQKAKLKPGPGDTFQIRHWLQTNPNPQTWLKSTSAIAQNLCVKILKLFIHSFIHSFIYANTHTRRQCMCS